MAGMGGIFTEVYEDVAFRLAPVNAQDAERMLEDLTARKVFSGYRRPVDRPALVNILLALSRMAEAENVLQLDLNPIFLYENGAIVIDAKGVVGG
jgi:hypothetical protein